MPDSNQSEVVSVNCEGFSATPPPPPPPLSICSTSTKHRSRGLRESQSAQIAVAANRGLRESQSA